MVKRISRTVLVAARTDAGVSLFAVEGGAAGLTRRPLSPVHGRVRQQADGTVALSWCRRSRGSWQWLDGVDAPLNEQTEAYVVGIGAVDDPSVRWNTAMPELTIPAPDWATLHAAHAGQPLWVRQVGTAALSPTLLLTTLD